MDKNIKKEVSEIFQLHIKTLDSHPLNKKLKITSFLSKEKKALSEYIQKCMNDGIYEVYHLNNKVSAAFLYDNNSFKILYSLTSKNALAWIANIIHDNAPQIKHSASFNLFPSQHKLIHHLCEHGFHIKMVVLMGNLSTAKKYFAQHIKHEQTLIKNNITYEALTSSKDLNQVMRFFKHEMTQHPENFSSNNINKDLSELKSKIKKDLGCHPAKRFILLKNKKVVGYFGFDIWENQPGFGNIGGSDLCFSEEIQNKGLVKDVYKAMFKMMELHNIQYISGATAQTSIMSLSKLMGRKPIRYLMGKGKGHFQYEHFDMM